MAMTAHQKVRPISTTTAPMTRLKTLTFPPHQKANCCHGFPCRSAAGITSM
jgi:hypothetical protein